MFRLVTSRVARANYFAYFFIIMGFCTLFGGLITYVTSVGTIIQGVTAQIATPYIVIGFILMAIGFGVLMININDQNRGIEIDNMQRMWI